MWDEVSGPQGRMMSDVAYYFIFLINSVYINYECFLSLMIHCIASLLYFSCSLEYICYYLFKLGITDVIYMQPILPILAYSSVNFGIRIQQYNYHNQNVPLKKNYESVL